MHFDSPLPPLAVLVATVLLIAALIRLARAQRGELPHGLGWASLLLRLAAVVMAALLALNPYWVRHAPDADGFRLALLADASGSMHARDLDGQARIDFAAAQVATDSPDNLMSRLQRRYHQLDAYAFSDRLLPLPPAGLTLESGQTAIGSSLEEVLARDSAQGPLGGLVLLSDGISLQGMPLMDAALALRDAGAPVTVIGVGDENRGGDASVELSVRTAEPLVGEPLELEAAVTGTFSQTVTATVEIADGETVLIRQEVTLKPGETVHVPATTVPERSGFHNYRARLADPVPDDRNQSNDLAFAAADVAEPRVMKALYLSSHLNDTYRFLRETLRQDPDWDLRAVIRISDERFAYLGFEDKPQDENAGFSAVRERLVEHSALIVETAAVAEMDQDERQALLDFLTLRGGGVVFFGPPENLPADLRYLLPVRQSETLARPKQTPLELTPDPVFTALAGGSLFRPPPLFLPEGRTAFVATELSRGARTVLAIRQNALPLLSVHAYGAGRVAYLGTAATWRWRMSSEHGQRQHELFWRYLLGWLGSGGKPRLEMPLQGTIVAVDEPVALDVDVRGPDFRPAEDARVSAILTPDGGEPGPPVNLVPDPARPGRYQGTAALEQPGEARVEYRVSFPDGEELRQEAWFAGAHLGRENADLAFRERELRDLARVSGGEYVSWRDVDKLDQIPLRADVPMRESRVHWTRNLPFALLLVLAAGIEWILRRRAGLT
ncbi:VWA domain-containing protein [Ruficoccus amylovorans]|uniref:VWA domain-containing protein n=1 Tax=Ruficoccus amylovorans TaxID=1804625 RepID=A0A842HGA8_9BACT|nr:vWA domain-containing protein [Ruficoccus amylovorans]MBC2595563.1 VWA domain-containing protein [Ruficoccus amylovorans]